MGFPPLGVVRLGRCVCSNRMCVRPEADHTSVLRLPWRGGFCKLSKKLLSDSFVVRMWPDHIWTQLPEELRIFWTKPDAVFSCAVHGDLQKQRIVWGLSLLSLFTFGSSVRIFPRVNSDTQIEEQLRPLWPVSDVNIPTWLDSATRQLIRIRTNRVVGVKQNQNDGKMQQCLFFCIWSRPRESNYRWESTLELRSDQIPWWSDAASLNTNERICMLAQCGNCSLKARLYFL